MAIGWRADSHRNEYVTELLSKEKCNKVVMDFILVNDVGKFLTQPGGEVRDTIHTFISCHYLCI